MATRNQFKMTTAERRHRHFSDSFKIQKVRELETGKTKVSELCKQYEVAATNVYRWLYKFGSMKDKKEQLIVETDSDTRQLLALKKKVAELEQIVGQKQILIDFKDKMIDLAEETYGVDNELPRRKQTEYQPQKAKTKYAASGWGINPKEIKVKAQYLFTFLHFHIDKFGFPIVFQMNI